MRILYIHQYFVTPNQAGGTRSFEISRHLIGQGHQVTMITSGLSNSAFPVRPGEMATAYDVQGIRLLSVRGGYNDAEAGTGLPAWRRMLAFHGFARAATWVGKNQTKPDLVFATHTPLMVGFSGVALKKHFGVPFVFEVRDLWPEALVNIGVLTNPFVIAYLRWLSLRFYKAADHISAASPGMRAGIMSYGISGDKVTVVTNACDLELFDPRKDGEAERQRLGLGNRFAAIYFGAMGRANGLDYVLDAAGELKKRKREDIVIVLHGSGGCEEGLRKRAIHEGLDNVVFSAPVPKKEQMSRIVAGCDACLTIYRATKEFTWSPNKFFDGLAAGKPVVVNVPGWLGDLVTDNRCGIQSDPANPASLADSLVRLADNPILREECSRNARRLAEAEFAREKQASNLEKVFCGLVGGST